MQYQGSSGCVLDEGLENILWSSGVVYYGVGSYVPRRELARFSSYAALLQLSHRHYTGGGW